MWDLGCGMASACNCNTPGVVLSSQGWPDGGWCWWLMPGGLVAGPILATARLYQSEMKGPSTSRIMQPAAVGLVIPSTTPDVG